MRQLQQQARMAAEQTAQQAQLAADQQAAQRERAQAEAAKAQAQAAEAEARAQKAHDAQQAAEQSAQQMAQQAEQERERLKQQLNQVLPTTETARGLIVNMSDVLFDFNKYTLKPEAREKLAKVSGILLAYPNLKLQVEGYTDNIGTDEYNHKLSEERADSVRDYLAVPGSPGHQHIRRRLWQEQPLADNSTNAGRAQNRRVRVSGFRFRHRHPAKRSRGAIANSAVDGGSTAVFTNCTSAAPGSCQSIGSSQSSAMTAARS